MPKIQVVTDSGDVVASYKASHPLVSNDTEHGLTDAACDLILNLADDIKAARKEERKAKAAQREWLHGHSTLDAMRKAGK